MIFQRTGVKNPTNFNMSSMASLGSSSPIWVLTDFWSFLSKGVHSLLHVGLLHVTKAIRKEREEKMKAIWGNWFKCCLHIGDL